MEQSGPPITFGRPLRAAQFLFSPSYTPLNHGSHGAFPLVVRSHQRALQDAIEARSDPFLRLTLPSLLLPARTAAASLLGAPVANTFFIPNATAGINIVLHNLTFHPGDVIIYLSCAYKACINTVLSLSATTPAIAHRIDLSFPLSPARLVSLLADAIASLRARGLNPRIAMFDTVATFPGLRLPWESLVAVCRQHDVFSLVDGAHGIGHIDLRHLHVTKPDFFTSNCYKWLFVPRPCAVLYVAEERKGMITRGVPTSTVLVGEGQGLQQLFEGTPAGDPTPYLCVEEAVRWREEVLGGEERIREYCFDLARTGGRLVAKELGTEVLDDGEMAECCFAMVRLPLSFDSDKEAGPRRLRAEDGPRVVAWITETLVKDHDTWIPVQYFQGAAWTRLSAQVYLEIADFEWAARILKALCNRVMNEEVPERD
ncbi:hypothetical protein CAC42_7909 [Sphaceloma murrayae]|uniref:Aminotransferase class V domain-containing protein n=1 Tax=Sphaceloma murrayae TaxID=2082308 RepID=A0A2K1QY14_9PEZI|nr:hypothetical protein CAC42_7909 [Sphaceloma murrayae]